MTGTALLDPRYNLTFYDIHALTAIAMFGRLTPANRTKAKIARYRSTFGAVYGMGAHRFVDYATSIRQPQSHPHYTEQAMASTFAQLRELAARHTIPVLTVNRRPEVPEPTAADITIEHRTPAELDFSAIEERVMSLYTAKRREGPLPEGERFDYSGTVTGRMVVPGPNFNFDLPKRLK